MSLNHASRAALSAVTSSLASLEYLRGIGPGLVDSRGSVYVCPHGRGGSGGRSLVSSIRRRRRLVLEWPRGIVCSMSLVSVTSSMARRTGGSRTCSATIERAGGTEAAIASPV
jgi:hypothetical protein